MSIQKKMTIGLPDNLKEEVERISEETGISQVRLITLATYGLVANYNKNGLSIFESLLDVSKKNVKSGEEG